MSSGKQEEIPLSQDEQKELNDGFKANPKAMKLMGGLQLKAKKKAAEKATAEDSSTGSPAKTEEVEKTF